MVLTDIQKGMAYKQLASKTMLEVGKEFGLDKVSKTENGVRKRVSDLANEVLADPAKFGISEEVVALVQKAKRERYSPKIAAAIRHGRDTVMLSDKADPYKGLEVTDLVASSSKKVLIALNKKLDWVLKSPANLKNTPLAVLNITAGTMFDKFRITRGEATEHIAMKAKISTDMSAKDKIDLVLKMREMVSEEQTDG